MTRLKRLLPILFAAVVAAAVFACADNTTLNGTDSPPVITCGAFPLYYVEQTVTVVNAVAADERDGALPVSYAIFAPSGKEVGVSSGKFVPHETGEYKITYYAQDRSGNVASLDRTFSVLAADEKPIVVFGEYEEYTHEGELYVLPAYSVTEAGISIPVSVDVTAPGGGKATVDGDKFLADRTGMYTLDFAATLPGGATVSKSITVFAEHGDKSVAGVDGVLGDKLYEGASRTILGGLRDLEKIFVTAVRTDDGIYFAFDGSEDRRVSRNEYIDVYFASTDDGLSCAKKLNLYPTGDISYFAMQSGAYRPDNEPQYYARPVYAVKLGAGASLEPGNTDDGGYTSELFVPYEYLGVEQTDSVYFTLGCVREGDPLDWDGWNDFPIFPDPQSPHRYIELCADGALLNINRKYVNKTKADGMVDDPKYYGASAGKATVGGLRNLEGAVVRIAYGDDGLYFAFSVENDKKVNDYDRVEVCLNAGDPTDDPNTACLQFWVQSSGGLSVLRGNGSAYVGFEPDGELPAAWATYGDRTTRNKNDDEDNGYYAELFVPYSLFNVHTSASGVGKNSRFGITFGIWRASESYHTDLSWGNDPNKDWDGYNNGAFCDPLFPKTYAVLLPDGRIVSRSEVVEIIGDPSDPSVDGVLGESYWKDAAKLVIAPTAELDGVTTAIYRDSAGLRIAFYGEVRRYTSKDAIALYISTRDSYYTIGGNDDGDSEYDVFGRYASDSDYCFHIWLDRSVAAYRGKYKDWADRITDLSAVSLQIVRGEHDFVAEMYVPYSFFTGAQGGPSAEDTLGVSVRLAGENERGSVMWNNLHYAGIYADSESPASYVRIDKDNKLFASTRNDASVRVDGEFDDGVYSQSYAEIKFGESTVKLYRGADGIYGRISFAADENCVSLAVSTIDHGLGKPYVYDYRIDVYRDGRVKSAFGNSHGFYDPDIYVSYCAPRAVQKGGDAELFIPYEYLSRYNVGSAYGQKGYMRITESSALKVAAAYGEGCTYNGERKAFNILDPSTYAPFAVKEDM